jgi:hypothetical protein
MVTEQGVDAMERGVVGSSVIVAAVLGVAALVAILVGEIWAIWPLIPLTAIELVFLALWGPTPPPAIERDSARPIAGHQPVSEKPRTRSHLT